MTTVVQEPEGNPSRIREAAAAAIGRMTDEDWGCVIVIIGKDGKTLTVPVGLNFAGRLKALASGVDTLADELFEKPGFTKWLKSYAAKINAVAEQLRPKP